MSKRRIAELLLLYVVAPGLIAIVSARHRWVILPAMLAGGVLSFALLPRIEPPEVAPAPSSVGLRRELLPMLLRAGLVLSLLLAILWATGHPPSFRLPREQPLVWLGVLALYPFLSAVPQEMMCRALFFHRYGELFPTTAARIAASALLFGWAHVLVHNWVAMLLATAGGVLLSFTWHRSRSLLLVGIEHWLYGAFLLSTGIGGMFANGIRFVSLAVTRS